MATVRPDALLQALMLAAFAMLLQSFASESLIYAPAMGFFFGLAYLTKSFAFLIALITIALMMVFQGWVQRRKPVRVIAAGALAFVVFAAIAGPYIGALSKQKHRFDFGDSGALNYAWYVSGTVKMHIEPSMSADFGSAKVNLIHPEQQLLAQPGIYSYRAEPYGTYPAWFDPTYFHERIVPVFSASRLIHRDVRNVVLSFRYLLNHPEAWILLILLLVCGARFGFTHARTSLHHWRHSTFWAPSIFLGLAMWGIYGLVNIEERYVTLAYLLIVLPVFAALVYVPELPDCQADAIENPWPRRMAAAMVAVLAFLALGETLRVALENRRNESAAGLSAAWVQPNIVAAAKGLNALGVGSGDEIACMGTIACLNDPYWMRLANVRVLTEVYNPDAKNLLEEYEGLPNRQQVVDVLKAQGAKVVVAAFDPGEMTGSTPASAGWIRLGESNLYALPLNNPAPATRRSPATLPWDMTRSRQTMSLTGDQIVPQALPSNEAAPIELSVVMPCLNEAETLAVCVDKALAALAENHIAGEVIVADNGSTDGSQQIAIDHGARVVPVPVRGYGAALNAGIRAARGKYVLMADADDSYEFAHIPRFLAELRDGLRPGHGQSLSRRHRPQSHARRCIAISATRCSASSAAPFSTRPSATSTAASAPSAKTPTSASPFAPPAWSSPARWSSNPRCSARR